MSFIYCLLLSLVAVIYLPSCAPLYTARLDHYHYTRNASFADQGHPRIIMPVYIDRDFSLADQLAIDDSLQQWNYALNGYYIFKVIDTHFAMQDDILRLAQANQVLVFLKIDHSNKLFQSIKLPGDRHALAFTIRVGGHIIYVVRNDIESEDDLRRLMMHEEGHTLGAKDIHDEHSLMNWSYIPVYFQCIDLRTLEQIAPVQGLPLEQLNYCTQQ